MMLTQVCAEIRNYFSSESDKVIGNFSITNNEIAPSISIQDGQYFRIVDSVFNDGVHRYGDVSDTLKDEPEFHGAVWLMRVPQDFLDLVSEIEAWQEKNADVLASPYQSESFGSGGYSYTKASGGNGNGGGSYTWKDAFASQLNRYRKIRLV